MVYRVDGDLLRNETNHYRAMAEAAFRDETPRFINIGDAIFGEFLGRRMGPGEPRATAPCGAPPRSRSADRAAWAEACTSACFARVTSVLRLSIDGAAIAARAGLSRQRHFGIPGAARYRPWMRPARSEVIAEPRISKGP